MEIAPHEIAFDFDGVVADTFRLFVRMANQDYGINIAYEDITDYMFLNVIDMDREIADKIIEQLTDIPHELDLRPNKGAAETLARLTQINPVLFVTARPYGNPVELWFRKNMPNLAPCIRIEATGASTTKLPVLKDKGVRYFVDDRLDTCQMLAQNGITPILYDQPWNRHPHPFQIVRDWEDIARLIAW